MAYRKKIYRFKNAVEIEEYHTARYGAPGMIREKRSLPTPEEMEKQNRLNREKKARRKLRANFHENDYYTDLTYAKEERPPNMEAAKMDFRQFIRKMREVYSETGHELKWMRNIEAGSKGAWHIHLVVNRIPDTDIILQRIWAKGKVVNKLLYEEGEFRELAGYITKTPETDKRLVEASYSCSRNLPIPKPEKKEIQRWETFKGRGPKAPKGWYVDKESVREGITKFGWPYRSYTLLRLHRRP